MHQPLHQLCDFRSGGTPSKAQPAFWAGHIPWISPKDMKSASIADAADHISDAAIHDSAASIVPPESILVVVRSGVLAHSFPIARALARVSFNQDIKALVPKQDLVDPQYLFWFVRSKAPDVVARGVKKGATVHSVISGFLEELQVPIPGRAEQRSIVDLLSRAEGIVRLRREAQRKAAELIPAIFVDMFGDPATNPKHWPMAALGDYLKITSAVKTPDLEEDASLACIGADSIESGNGKIVSWPTVGEVRPISGKYFFKRGDVLYSKIRPVLKKAVLAPTDGYCSADMYPLRPNELATSEFTVALLLTKDFTDYAVGVSMRAQMPKVNRETLFAYKAPLPPIALQRHFAAKAKAVRSIVAQQTAALATAQATFDALLHQAFA